VLSGDDRSMSESESGNTHSQLIKGDVSQRHLSSRRRARREIVTTWYGTPAPSSTVFRGRKIR
jgi:hypothetical protein